MSAADFAAIIAAAPVRGIHLGDAVLAARIPALCPTCTYANAMPDDHAPDAACPDCPTIAKLLAIGAAVMTGIRDGDVRLAASDRDLCHMQGYEIHQDDGKRELLAELRSVAS